MAAVALLATSPQVKAQTTFVGSWIQYVPGIYGDIVEMETEDWSGGEPWQRSGYSYVGSRSEYSEASDGILDDGWFHFYRWRPILQEPQLIPQTDNHWNNANVWTDGVPSGTTDARITKSGSLILPTINETAAVARSLTVFDADNTISTFELLNGVLSLTPASVLNTSLKVGVANANGGTRTTVLTLVNSSITSSGFAEIGKGQAGSGPLSATMIIETGSGWYHPAGLIEIGGAGGDGYLLIKDGGAVAGSLLPGAATDPRVAVNSGSNFVIKHGGTARLSELSVNSIAGPYYLLFGFGVSGSLETSRLMLGETAPGQADFFTGSDSRLGAVTISRDSELMLQGSNLTVVADTVVIDDGRIKVDALSAGAQLTVGNTASEQGGTRIFELAPASGDLAALSVTGTNNAVTVRGRAILGGYGAASVTITNGGVLDIRGSATLGEGGSSPGEPFGSGTVNVSGAGSIFRVQNLEVGYNYGDYRGAPSPLGLITVDGGGRVEVTGYINGTGWSALPDAEGNYTEGPTIEAGRMTLGKNGTLDILAGGQLAFTDPSGGTAVRQYGVQTLTSSGLIQGGGTTATDLGGGSHIDFGTLGGKLVNTGTIAPGHSAGWLSLNGDLSFQDPMSFSGDNGRLLIELGGTTAGLGYDVLEVLGDVDLTGATVEFSLIDGYAPQQGATYHFLQVSGLLTGMFGSVTDNTGLGLTLGDLSIAPGGGVMLTMPVSAIPEVGTILPALGAILAAGWRLRRKWLR